MSYRLTRDLMVLFAFLVSALNSSTRALEAQQSSDGKKFQKDGLWWFKRGNETLYYTGKRWTPFVPHDDSRSARRVWEQMRALISGNVDARTNASWTLQDLQLADHAFMAAPLLIDQLDHADQQLRDASQAALGKIAATRDEVVEDLLTTLQSGSPTARASAALALGAFEMSGRATQTVPALVMALDDRNANVRAAAARALGTPVSRVTKCEDPVPGLTKALDDADSTVRYWASISLAEIGPRARTAIPKLAALLATDPHSSMHAFSAYDGFGAEAKATVPLLVDSLSNPDRAQSAAMSLGNIGREAARAVPKLIALANSNDYHIRLAALRALGGIGVADPAVPTLLVALQDRTSYPMPGGTTPQHVRVAAATSLAELAPFSHTAIPGLVRSLRDNDDRVFTQSTRALGLFGPVAEPAVSELIRLLKSGPRTRRSNVAYTLSGIGPPAKEALPALVAALEDPDGYVRSGSLTALIKLGEGRLALSALKRELEGSTFHSFQELARLAAQVGPPARGCMPRLKEILNTETVFPDKRSDLRYARLYAAHALYSIDPRQIDPLPHCIPMLHEHQEYYSLRAAEMLGDFGSMALAAVPDMQKVMHADLPPMSVHHRQHFHRKLADSWVRMGVDANAIMPALKSCLEDRFYMRRADAAYAIGKFGPRAASHAQELIEALQDEYVVVRAAAATALGELGPEAKGSVEALAAALGDEFITVRESALQALTKLGPASVAAKPQVTELLQDSDEQIRKQATQLVADWSKDQ